MRLLGALGQIALEPMLLHRRYFATVVTNTIVLFEHISKKKFNQEPTVGGVDSIIYLLR